MIAMLAPGQARAPTFIASSPTEAAGDGTFEGYAAVFGSEDLARDVIQPGAFRRSLAERGVGGIRMLFQHDPNQPIGVWERIEEDGRGLKVRGRLTLDVAKAREVLSLLRSGALDGLSIGFKAGRFRRDAGTGIRRIEHVELWEISIVTFPMQPGARIAGVKSIPDRDGDHRDAAQARRQLRRAIALLNSAT